MGNIYNSPIIGISGPDGAGKGYLTEQLFAVMRRGSNIVQEVSMITTRKPREGEPPQLQVGQNPSEILLPPGKKLSVVDPVFDKWFESGQLVGAHLNDNGARYAYRVEDFKSLTGPAIIELNPARQAHIIDELRQLGLNFAGWIGLIGDLEYLEQNIKERQPDMSNDELTKKLGMAGTIISTLQDLSQQGHVTLFSVGWDNRDTMGEEFANLFKSLIATN